MGSTTGPCPGPFHSMLDDLSSFLERPVLASQRFYFSTKEMEETNLETFQFDDLTHTVLGLVGFLSLYRLGWFGLG